MWTTSPRLLRSFVLLGTEPTIYWSQVQRLTPTTLLFLTSMHTSIYCQLVSVVDGAQNVLFQVHIVLTVIGYSLFGSSILAKLTTTIITYRHKSHVSNLILQSAKLRQWLYQLSVLLRCTDCVCGLFVKPRIFLKTDISKTWSLLFYFKRTVYQNYVVKYVSPCRSLR